MTPAEVLQQASAAGLSLSMEAGLLRVTGPAETVARWRPAIAENKAAIIEELRRPGAPENPLQAESASSAAFCLWHENQQPGARCRVKNCHGPEQLTGCTLWRLKNQKRDLERYMFEHR